MNIYKDRIGPLFEKSGLTDKTLEEKIGLPRGIIYKWKTGKNKNYKFYIVEISAYFHVSTDYLLGRTDDPATVEQQKSPPQSGEPMYPKWYGELTPEETEQVRKYAEFLIAERHKGQLYLSPHL